MPEYVDGFVLPLPKSKVEAYRKIAKKASKIWIEHGALEYRECVGDDLKIKFGVPYPKMVSSKPSETIVFAWIVYKSKKHRDQVNAKVMKDPRLANMPPESMPFDMARMAYGGFTTLVKA